MATSGLTRRSQLIFRMEDRDLSNDRWTVLRGNIDFSVSLRLQIVIVVTGQPIIVIGSINRRVTPPPLLILLHPRIDLLY